MITSARRRSPERCSSGAPAEALRTPHTFAGIFQLLAISSTDLPAFFASPTAFEEVLVELGVLCQVGHRHLRAVTGDDRVDVLEVLAAFASVSPISTPLPPLLASSSGIFLPEKMSPACIDAQRREHHPRVTVRVAAAEIVQIDLVGALPRSSSCP